MNKNTHILKLNDKNVSLFTEKSSKTFCFLHSISCLETVSNLIVNN